MTPYGQVSVAWEIQNGKLTVKVDTEQPVPVCWELIGGQRLEETISGRTTRTVLLEPEPVMAAAKSD